MPRTRQREADSDSVHDSRQAQHQEEAKGTLTWPATPAGTHLLLPTQYAVARFWDVSVKTLGIWFGEGCPGKCPGGYAIDEMVLWLKDKWKAEGVRTADGSGGQGDLLEWSLRSEAADAQIKELKLQTLRGELIERDQVRRVAAESFTTLRLLLANLSDTAASCVPEEHRATVASEVRDLVDNALRTTRRALSRSSDTSGGAELSDPLGVTLRWLDDLPDRMAAPERRVGDRDRIGRRGAKLAAQLRAELEAGIH